MSTSGLDPEVLHVAVTEETEDRIEWREFSPTHEKPGEKVVIQKENVAGWKEHPYSLNSLPDGSVF